MPAIPKKYKSFETERLETIAKQFLRNRGWKLVVGFILSELEAGVPFGMAETFFEGKTPQEAFETARRECLFKKDCFELALWDAVKMEDERNVEGFKFGDYYAKLRHEGRV